MSKKKKIPEPAIAKDTPSDVACVMRKEALKNTGRDPTFRIYRGWRFGLSFGPVPTPTREMWEGLKRLPGGVEGILKRFSFESFDPSTRGLDDFTYEEFRARLDAVHDSVKTVVRTQWIFSASLHPRGRSSVQEDWRFYGEMAAAIGAPAESLMTPIETTDPNAVHYHIWSEIAASDPAAKAN